MVFAYASLSGGLKKIEKEILFGLQRTMLVKKRGQIKNVNWNALTYSKTPVKCDNL